MKLVLASGNAGKLAEMGQLLGELAIELIPQADLGIADVEETGKSFVENAILKARHASRLSGLPALGDDSGLCVDALGGAPGLLSARYAGEHGNSTANIARLLDALAGVAEPVRTAHFHCTIVLLQHPGDPAPLIAEGRWQGRILAAPRGEHGFGYDPVFLDIQHKLSAAEMEADLKNRLSHRGQAMTRLRTLLDPGH
jgi:XTP/dITP diphosphohydrolase